MSSLFHPSRGGVRGGKDQFSWEEVKNDKHRENYLGNSLMAPVGRWMNSKDFAWFNKDKQSAQAKADALSAERELVKQREAEAREIALGLRKGKTSTGNQATTKDVSEVIRREAENDEEFGVGTDSLAISGLGFRKSQQRRASGNNDMPVFEHAEPELEEDMDEAMKIALERRRASQLSSNSASTAAEQSRRTREGSASIPKSFAELAVKMLRNKDGEDSKKKKDREKKKRKKEKKEKKERREKSKHRKRSRSRDSSSDSDAGSQADKDDTKRRAKEDASQREPRGPSRDRRDERQDDRRDERRDDHRRDHESRRAEDPSRRRDNEWRHKDGRREDDRDYARGRDEERRRAEMRHDEERRRAEMRHDDDRRRREEYRRPSDRNPDAPRKGEDETDAGDHHASSSRKNAGDRSPRGPPPSAAAGSASKEPRPDLVLKEEPMDAPVDEKLAEFSRLGRKENEADGDRRAIYRRDDRDPRGRNYPEQRRGDSRDRFRRNRSRSRSRDRR